MKKKDFMFELLHIFVKELSFYSFDFIRLLYPYIICIAYAIYFWASFLIQNFWIIFIYIYLNYLIAASADLRLLSERYEFFYFLRGFEDCIFTSEERKYFVKHCKYKALQTFINFQGKVNFIKNNIRTNYTKYFDLCFVINSLNCTFSFIFDNTKNKRKIDDLYVSNIDFITNIFALYLCFVSFFTYYYAASICTYILIGIFVQLIFLFISCTVREELLSISFYITTTWAFISHELHLLREGHKEILAMIENWGKDFDFDLPERVEGLPAYFFQLSEKFLELIFTSFILVLVVIFLFCVILFLITFATSITLNLFNLLYILKF